MAPLNAQKDPFEKLAEEFIEKIRRGENPSVTQYAEEHPDLAVDIRELFPMIALMEKAGDPSPSSAGQQLVPKEVSPETLGDFRILREIGRGGMGVVYEAQQQSLRRRVAVKVLPQSALRSQHSLQRFQREAQTAAALCHTNVVPIFGVGEEGSRHYIVMQLISGVGMDEVLAMLVSSESGLLEDTTTRQEMAAEIAGELVGEDEKGTAGATYRRNVAGIGVQVARALAHAHQRGILHRDIKPSNLLLDAQGVVFVTDFGLAKLLEDDSVTRTGDVIGTLRYLAPERLRGEGDARSDVYSLGITLYEMLALRPAYAASDAGGLVKKISAGPPPRLGTVAPKIARDLETIVHKAIASDPAHRYPSADAMADDLERFRTGRPILARQISFAGHLWRWGLRNRALAGLSALAIGLLITVALVASVGYVQTYRALEGESEQRRKADATSQLATKALDDIFTQFAPDDLSLEAKPHLSRGTAELFERLLVYYNQLALESNGEDSVLRGKRAGTYRRMGDIHAALGNYTQAETAYEKALQLYSQLTTEGPTSDATTLELARIYNHLGDIQVPSGSPEKAHDYLLQALETIAPLEEVEDASAAVRYLTARICSSLGKGTGRPGSSSQSGFEGPRKPPLHERPSPYLVSAINLLEQLVREEPTNPSYLHLLACCYRDLPPLPREQGGAISLAVDILQKLVEDHPEIPAYQHDLAKTRFLVAKRLGRTPRERISLLTVAQRELQKLTKAYPNEPRYTFTLIQTHLALSREYTREAKSNEAEKELRDALRIQEAIVASSPENTPNHLWLAQIQTALAELLLGKGDLVEARVLLESALSKQPKEQSQRRGGPHENVFERAAECLSRLDAKQKNGGH